MLCPTPESRRLGGVRAEWSNGTRCPAPRWRRAPARARGGGGGGGRWRLRRAVPVFVECRPARLALPHLASNGTGWGGFSLVFFICGGGGGGNHHHVSTHLTMRAPARARGVFGRAALTCMPATLCSNSHKSQAPPGGLEGPIELTSTPQQPKVTTTRPHLHAASCSLLFPLPRVSSPRPLTPAPDSCKQKASRDDHPLLAYNTQSNCDAPKL